MQLFVFCIHLKHSVFLLHWFLASCFCHHSLYSMQSKISGSSSATEVVDYFDILQSLFAYFSITPHRWRKLKLNMKKMSCHSECVRDKVNNQTSLSLYIAVYRRNCLAGHCISCCVIQQILKNHSLMNFYYFSICMQRKHPCQIC